MLLTFHTEPQHAVLREIFTTIDLSKRKNRAEFWDRTCKIIQLRIFRARLANTKLSKATRIAHAEITRVLLVAKSKW